MYLESQRRRGEPKNRWFEVKNEERDEEINYFTSATGYFSNFAAARGETLLIRVYHHRNFEIKPSCIYTITSLLESTNDHNVWIS